MDPKFHLAMSNPVHTGLVGTLLLTSCKTEHTLKLSFLNNGHSGKCRLKAHGLLGIPGGGGDLKRSPSQYGLTGILGLQPHPFPFQFLIMHFLEGLPPHWPHASIKAPWKPQIASARSKTANL